MKRDLNLFLNDILESIKRIESFSKLLNEEKFLRNELRQNAIIRQLEIIGEAVKNIPDSFRNKYPKVPWKDIAGFRDRLTHAYFGIVLERVWEVVKEDLPKLKKDILKIKNDLENSNIGNETTER